MTAREPTGVVLRGADATTDLGRRLGRTRPDGGGVVALTGHLGAGKTTLVKGLAEGIGVARADDVTSPTFLRLVRWECDDGPALVHVDAYRMQGADDVRETGLAEDFAGGAVVAIEWPEIIADALPEDRIEIELDHASESTRRMRIRATGPRSAAWIERAALLDAGTDS